MQKIQQILSETQGFFGISFFDLKFNEEFSLYGREIFPSASIIKVPLLLTVLSLAEQKAFSLEQTFILKEKDKTTGAGALQELHAGLEVSLLDLLNLMIVLSDNTATNMLIDFVGFSKVNNFLENLGLSSCYLGRKMMTTPPPDNLITPLEITRLLALLVQGTILSPFYQELSLSILKRQQDRSKIPRYLPEIVIANKTGELPSIRHDTAIIYQTDQPYILTILSKNLADDYEGDEIIGKISKVIYENRNSRI